MNIMLLFTTFASLVFFVYICSSRSKNETIWAAIALQLIAVIWAFSKLVETYAPTLEIQKLSVTILFAMVTLVGPTWLLFCFYLTDKNIKRKYIIFLPSIVFIIIIFSQDNLFFGLVNNRYYPQGILFLTDIILTCVYSVMGILLLTKYSRTCNELKRKQIKIVQGAFSIPFILGIFTTINIVCFNDSIPIHQISTSGFSLTVSLITYAIIKYRFLNLSSIASTLIVNKLKDPVLIFDTENNINYCNQAFESEFGIFKRIDNFLELITAAMGNDSGLLNAIYNESYTDFHCEVEFKDKIFFARINSIFDNNLLIGKIIAFNDVTFYKTVIASLEKVKTRDNCSDINEVSRMIELEYQNIKSIKFKNFNFTPVEIEIITLIAQGKSDKEIAALIFKSYGTVRNIVSNLLKRTGAENRTKLALSVLIKMEEKE
jgi:DNA-binding CsgD family transcriptional regulator/PAS domain-containing protein